MRLPPTSPDVNNGEFHTLAYKRSGFPLRDTARRLADAGGGLIAYPNISLAEEFTGYPGKIVGAKN